MPPNFPNSVCNCASTSFRTGNGANVVNAKIENPAMNDFSDS